MVIYWETAEIQTTINGMLYSNCIGAIFSLFCQIVHDCFT